MRQRSIPLPHFLTVLSAILIVAAFPPWDLKHLIWFALVPWLWLIRQLSSFRAAIVQGLWLSFLMTLGGFYWVAWVLHEFGGLPWIVAGLGLLLFGLICQPQFPIIALVLHRAKPRAPAEEQLPWKTAGLALALGLFYSGLDWVLPKLFVDTLGHAFYSSRILRQAADLGGAPLLTLVIFLANDAIASLALRLGSRQEPSYWPVVLFSLPQSAAAAVFVVFIATYGAIRAPQIETLLRSPLAQVPGAVIQGNIGDFDKIAAERGIRGAGEKVLSTYLSLSEQATSLSPRPQFLIWPETAYPSTFRTPMTSDDLYRDRRLEAFVRERGTPLLFGGYDRFQKKDFNALFVLAPHAPGSDAGLGSLSDLQIYRKNVLLLFGEFIPGAEWIKPLKDAFPQVGNFGRGVGPEIVQIPGTKTPEGSLKAGPVICYEALFPDYVIAAARKGSQLILNITNDSWFGPYGEPYLHLALTTFRSVETRLPQLRATNTGISTLTLPDGSIAKSTAILEPAILAVDIPVIAPVWTLMKAWGDWFGIFAFLSGSSVLLLALAPGISKKT